MGSAGKNGIVLSTDLRTERISPEWSDTAWTGSPSRGFVSGSGALPIRIGRAQRAGRTDR